MVEPPRRGSRSVFGGPGVDQRTEESAKGCDPQKGAHDGPPEAQIFVGHGPVVGGGRKRQRRQEGVEATDEDSDDAFHEGVIYGPR